MASFTLKNIPEPLLNRVRAAAELHHRSINGEILACLERSFGVALEPSELLERARQLRAKSKGPPLTWEEIQAAKVAGPPLIVVDTNVIAGLVLSAKRSDLAERLFEKDPGMGRSCNLAKRTPQHTRDAGIRCTGSLQLGEALEVAEAAQSLLAGREFSVDTASVLRLAVESRCTAYDYRVRRARATPRSATRHARSAGVGRVSQHRRVYR